MRYTNFSLINDINGKDVHIMYHSVSHFYKNDEFTTCICMTNGVVLTVRATVEAVRDQMRYWS